MNQLVDRRQEFHFGMLDLLCLRELTLTHYVWSLRLECFFHPFQLCLLISFASSARAGAPLISLSIFPGLTVSAYPETCEMPHLKPTEGETPLEINVPPQTIWRRNSSWGSSHLCFNKSWLNTSWFWCTLTLENKWSQAQSHQKEENSKWMVWVTSNSPIILIFFLPLIKSPFIH